MFIGHYSAALALKPVDKRLNLFWLFLAAEFLDILFAILVLAGIEHVRFVPGIAAANSLDLFDYPYSHSLPAALLWSVLAYGLVRWLPFGKAGNRNRAALAVSLAVFSHWILDFLVHIPDLAIWGDTKVGLGLWNSPRVSNGLEIGLFIVGLMIYLQSTRNNKSDRSYGFFIFGIVLGALFVLSTQHTEAPPDVTVFAVTGLVTNLLVAIIAGWLDRRRRSALS